MSVTMQQIADLAGVSRGTVDRALNNRGRIRPEMAEKIREIAKQLGYQPNMAAKTLSTGGQKMKIGVIIQYADTHFMKAVIRGAEDAKEEVERFGGHVMIEEIQGGDVKQVLDAMEIFQKMDVRGIVLVPTDDELLRKTIDRYVEEKAMEVMTINSDLKGTKRRCFIGQDNMAAGRVAGGLMGEILPENGTVMILSGFRENAATKGREDGFQMELEKNYPGIQILKPFYAYDDDWVSGKIVEEQLEKVPDLKGIYITAQGESGVCKTLRKYGLEHKVKVIAHDYEGENRQNLKEGIINFILRQNAYVQGHDSVMELFHSLCGNPMQKGEYWYTDIVIKTPCNA